MTSSRPTSPGATSSGATSSGAASAVAVDGGALGLGDGVLALVRPALAMLEPGGVVAVWSDAPSLRDDLPSWCRAERHTWLGVEDVGGRDRHLVARGRHGAVVPADGVAVGTKEGRLTTADVLLAVPPPPVGGATGLAARGATIEPGGPSWAFPLADDRVLPDDVGALYDRAVAAVWDPSRDIPWDDVEPLEPAVERAVGQVMAFLAENEVAALYVPSTFLPRIHPAYVETAMFLATQLADEARHIDAFLKRARLRGGGVGTSSAMTAWSLHALFGARDFVEASFLLSVLGEGTFLDLLKFVEDHAPDVATREVARRARADEARHVHFGLAHVRHALARDEGLFARLEGAVRDRASRLAGHGGIPANVQDALTVLAAGSTSPAAVRRGHEAFRELLHTMDTSRRRRLVHAGFTEEQSERLSALHTPNFM